MTEDEAKTKRCGGSPGCGTLTPPEKSAYTKGSIKNARIAFLPDYLKESLVNYNAPRWCIGSECMMWRYEHGKIETDNKVKGDRILTNGYCGLGGKP